MAALRVVPLLWASFLEQESTDGISGGWMVAVVRLSWGRRWLCGGVLWGSAAVPAASQGGHLFPLCGWSSFALLAQVPLMAVVCGGELRAFRVVSVHLCSTSTQRCLPTLLIVSVPVAESAVKVRDGSLVDADRRAKVGTHASVVR